MDVSLGQVFGHELLQGRKLYTELWDHRPPLTYLANSLAELLVGWGDAQILLLGTVLSVVTLLGVWYAASAVNRTAGLVAAALWTLVQADIALEAQHPNAEAFLNASIVWALALLVRGRSRWGPAILFAIASLTKANAVVFPAVLALTHIASADDRRGAARDVAAWLAIGLLAWAITVGWFAVAGRFDHLWEAIIAYPRYYAGSLSANLGGGLRPANLLHPVLLALAPAAVLCAAAFLRGQPARPRALLAGSLIAAWLAVSMPGKFFFHYYQLYMPPVVIGAGWGAAALLHRSRNTAAAILAIALIVTTVSQVPAYVHRGEAWVRRAFPADGERYIAQMRVIPRVRALLPRDATMYQFGSQSAYYVATRTSPPTGVLFLSHMVAGPAAARLTTMALADLEQARPALIIYDSVYADYARDHPVHRWILAHYEERPELSGERRARILTPRARR
ncbi:MAG TPA: glycosyltransferase family 39 protein [Longimicrobiales bacterium]